MKVLIHANLNGYGLSKDVEVLRSVLTDHEITVVAPNREAKGKFDIAFHVEHLVGRNLSSAKVNVAIPNPEWFSRANGLVLQRCDFAIAKTRYTEKLLMDAYSTIPVHYTGWTSPDPYIEGEYRVKGLVHVGGNSPLKSTHAVIEAFGQVKLPASVYWRRTPSGVPVNVTMVKEYMDRPPFHMNIHVLPSQAEGFGHIHNEALACGCTVISTDHPPMNEFPAQYLVPITGTHKQGHAQIAHLDTTELRRMILQAWEHAPLYDPTARAAYLARDYFFRQTFKELTCLASA